MRHPSCVCLAAVLASLVASGCDFGAVASDQPLDPSAALTEQSQDASAATPGLPLPDPAEAPEAAPPDDTAQVSSLVLASFRATTPDCLDFSTGSFRLIPCTPHLQTTNLIGHDDPDPWRSTPTPCPTR